MKKNTAKDAWKFVKKGDGCWSWTGRLSYKGYGEFWFEGKNHPAHRVVYEILIEKIPDGFVIDHLCRNRACTNPDHMKVVTNKENVLRGIGITAQNKRKTHCHRGHELTEENVWRKGHLKEWRSCRECSRIHKRGFRERLKRKKLAATPEPST